jgi:peptidoglycan hydrolase CwlO-like protein
MKTFSLILLAFVLFSCGTQRKIDRAKKVFNSYPDSFAYQCDLFFPFKDSIGEPVIKYIPADNKNYTAKIDSLTSAVKDLDNKLKKDTSNIAKYYKGIVSKLASDIGRLKNNYKPCEPDTLKISYKTYKESTRKNKVYENQINDLKSKLEAANKELKEVKETASNRLYTIIGLSLLLCFLIFAFIRK